ncbi:MAG: hypothetical protein J3R72DRAFT_492787 [Linnemannia gamsii]|nr:MAG: hypothetical protein J3R72DRAFT_492787 [Linnemannia gamsii]
MVLPQDILADVLENVEWEYAMQPQLCQKVVAKLADKTGRPPTLIKCNYKSLNAADRLARLDDGQKRIKSEGFSRSGTYVSHHLKTVPASTIGENSRRMRQDKTDNVADDEERPDMGGIVCDLDGFHDSLDNLHGHQDELMPIPKVSLDLILDRHTALPPNFEYSLVSSIVDTVHLAVQEPGATWQHKDVLLPWEQQAMEN